MRAPEVTREQDQFAESLALDYDHVSVERRDADAVLVRAFDEPDADHHGHREEIHLVFPDGDTYSAILDRFGVVCAVAEPEHLQALSIAGVLVCDGTDYSLTIPD